LRRASRRGRLVTAGFLGVFAVIGLPISLGATAIARALPWLGIAVAVALSVVGVLVLAGATVRLPVRVLACTGRARGAGAMLLFGAGYGAASLGCTLPLFLILVGASIGSEDVGATLLVFAAYGLGMAVVLTVLAIRRVLERCADFDAEIGIVDRRPDVARAFDFSLAGG
jgi:cytochrome c biogenesis protein CcdA